MALPTKQIEKDEAARAAAPEGWVYIQGATKWHYVGRPPRSHISLCGKWLYLGSDKPDPTNHDSRDNCATCRKRRIALASAAGIKEE
jgi:hypothetical protein